ncbi:hypothetical protein F5B22DRAFT_628731 [Xylaria bambusicola]|uniref:uncharacterized protein n=1 Tax=Xylaria bambusicola TaxID=326684 RepID=UPI00200823BE|nr:uncharacterized protein F5B22DRAFT_628731 [Xylaria bambusicola]KAI0505150.1 hypothetical protein F5B22DRAFT_628731 [Xylaria bambusicola]
MMYMMLTTVREWVFLLDQLDMRLRFLSLFLEVVVLGCLIPAPLHTEGVVVFSFSFFLSNLTPRMGSCSTSTCSRNFCVATNEPAL